MTQKILILMGSFRKKSFSRSIANYVASSLPQGWEASFAPLDDLPLFNQDYDDEGTTPQSWADFRNEVSQSDAVLFVTPEHNRSYPAVLKNALDIASRPPEKSVWARKPAAIISTSPGRIGGALANQHIRQPLSFLNLDLMLQPEMYISDVTSLLDAEGVLVDERTKKHLDAFVEAFMMWINKAQ